MWNPTDVERSESPTLEEILMKTNLIPFNLPPCLKVVKDNAILHQVWQLRQKEFSQRYPAVSDCRHDIYDNNAYVLYSEDEQGNIISTGRITFDSSIGLPADKIIKTPLDQLRKQGVTLAEPSKFAISREALGILPMYICAYYQIAASLEIDKLIFIIPSRHASIYEKTAKANIAVPDIGYSYGTRLRFSLLTCDVKEMGTTLLNFWGDK